MLQSATVTQQLESSQAQLASVSGDLYRLQQVLQQQRFEHAQAMMVATANKQAAVNKVQQEREVTKLQASEQRLSAELSEAKQQLTQLLQQLEEERATSGKLHSQVAKLHAEFSDTRAAVDTERKRAAALADERSRLEAALQKAAAAAAAAEADAAAAQREGDAATRKAQAAAEEAEGAKVQLSEAKGQAQELGHQLHVAVEVVAQQQATLQERSQQIGALQKEVVVTRECSNLGLVFEGCLKRVQHPSLGSLRDLG